MVHKIFHDEKNFSTANQTGSIEKYNRTLTPLLSNCLVNNEDR